MKETNMDASDAYGIAKNNLENMYSIGEGLCIICYQYSLFRSLFFISALCVLYIVFTVLSYSIIIIIIIIIIISVICVRLPFHGVVLI
jgi:hypothetical protein